MKYAIYRSVNKTDTYLYIEHENDFKRVPESLLKLLGRLELVMNLELTPSCKLARADAAQVRQHLREHGYFLQLPPKDLGTVVIH